MSPTIAPQQDGEPQLAYLSPALDRFWERWHRAGFDLTTEERLRVEVLLQGIGAFGEDIDRERLQGLLCPLVARSPQAQTQFRRIFADCFADDTIIFELHPTEIVPELEPVADTYLVEDAIIGSPPSALWWQSWCGGLVIMACFAAMSTALLVPRSNWVAIVSTSPSPTASGLPSPSPTPPPRINIQLATPPPKPSAPSAPPTSPPASEGPIRLLIKSETIAEPDTVIPWFLGLGLLVPIVLYWVNRWQRIQQQENAKEKREENAKEIQDVFHLPLVLPGAPEFSFSEPPDSRLPLHVRRSTIATFRGASDTIDGQRSVEATLEAGGAPRFLFGTRRYRRAIVALIEREGLNDHRTPYYIALLRRLDRLGADIRVFFVAKGKQGLHCQALVRRESGFLLPETALQVPLVEALRPLERQATSLLYFGSQKLLQEKPGKPSTLRAVLSQDWQLTTALVWEPETGLQEQAITDIPPSPASWDVIEAIFSPRGEPVFDLGKAYPAAVFEYDVTFWKQEKAQEVAEELKAAMPPGAFLWLCACAALPEVRWDLTMELGRTLDAARRNTAQSEPIVTESNLLALLGLPWFLGRGATTLAPIASALRGELLRRLPERLRSAVLNRTTEIILRSLPEGKLPEKAASFAQVQLGIELLIQQELRGDDTQVQKLVEWLDACGKVDLLLDNELCKSIGPTTTRIEVYRDEVRKRVGPPRTPVLRNVLWLGGGVCLSGLGALVFPNFGKKIPRPPIVKRFVAPSRGNVGEVRGATVQRKVLLVNETTKTAHLTLTRLPESDIAFQLDSFAPQDVLPKGEVMLPVRFDTANAKAGDVLKGSVRVQENGTLLADIHLTAGASPSTGSNAPRLVAKRYSPDEFREYLNNIHLDGNFNPKYVTLHHYSKSISIFKQGITDKDILSITNTPQGIGRNDSGSHVFIDQNGIWVFRPLNRRAVHANTLNDVSIGVNLVGNYDSETLPDSIKTNATQAIAAIDQWLGKPASSLKFHREDHVGVTCPGSRLVKVDFVSAIAAIMTPTITPPRPTLVTAAEKARKAGFPALANYLASMVLVKDGSFTMGANDITKDEKPPHKVTLTKPFVLGKTGVTVEMWQEYCDKTGRKMPNEPDFNKGWSKKNHPIVRVSWNDIMGKDGKGGYCQWASSVSGIWLQLPTEAQREYATCGPKSLAYPWEGKWDETKCVNGTNSKGGTAKVGSMPKWESWCGALDLSGNVWEWCLDLYESYAPSASQDPTGAKMGDRRVIKGGSWDYFTPRYFRGASRSKKSPDDLNLGLGFRLCAGP